MITCYADGSCDPAARLSTWAVHLRGPGGQVVERAGRCPAYVGGSSAAEMSAAYAGVSLARRLWPDEPRMCLITDCQSVMRAIRSLTVARDPVLVFLLGRVRASGLTVDACWTKGHRDPQDDTDAYINDRVDRAARHELALWLRASGLTAHGSRPDPVTAPLYESRKRLERLIRQRYAGHVESTATRRWVGYATLLRCFAAVRTASLAHCHAMIAALDPA